MHDEILQMLLESDPETTEQILKRISAENGYVSKLFVKLNLTRMLLSCYEKRSSERILIVSLI